MTPEQLEAVVAHQLGYQLVPHWRRGLESLMLWYSLPARGFALLGRWAWPILRRIPALGCLVFGILGSGVLVVILVSAYFGNLDTAAALGYGPALLGILYQWQKRDIEHTQPGRQPTATHRIATLERHLQRLSGS